MDESLGLPQAHRSGQDLTGPRRMREVFLMRSVIRHAVYVAMTAGTALLALGLAGAAAPAAAPRSAGSPVYSSWMSGYQAQGPSFRWATTTLTVAPRQVPYSPATGNGTAVLLLADRHGIPGSELDAGITVKAGGGSVTWGQTYGGFGAFSLRPAVGDRLTLGIYYDRHGHTYFTVTDHSQRVTRSVRVTLSRTPRGGVEYTTAGLYVLAYAFITPPPARDTQLWQFAGTRLTTYSGARGTMLGPWTTSKIIATNGGVSAGSVVASPSALRDHGQDFGVWLRSLPLTYTSAFAGYADSTGPFRFVSADLTVPARQVPPANGGTALVALGHNGGATPRPYANIEVLPGGGAGSISYTCNAASGRFTISPRPGDRVTVSIYYDRNGHYTFTAADTTQGTSQAVSAAAPYAGQMPLNSAEVLGMISNAAVTTPPAGIRLWQFTGIRVTTYNGTRSSILGPWATSEWTDTTGGTPAGAVVMSASTLSSAGGTFSVWLRSRS